ncbi:MAG: 2-C-methyl-D-erythritol 2,4-cyclodiphosphate synthase [Bacilli bacterium]|nr:2-C-methyl-D-erythritol 2,4-cyclodiphosphate synthase [Bacilli bacterium]MDD4077123.1 2-C-methyl-D-erythritol 2,4-cyclodiphosphate synthase [Bacilli bacterium]
MEYKIGHSRDVHRLARGRKLILGGIAIDYPLGLVGHSDADCVLHTVAESIIGALGLGDLGTHFPDNDPKYLGITSSYFIETVRDLLERYKYEICNLDITVILEKPVLAPYINLMRENISRLLQISPSVVNVKATRNEGLGYIGKGEAIAAECVVLIMKKTIIKKLL